MPILLTKKQNVSYGLGSFGTDIFWHSITLFLLIYYTDTLGISPVAAGLIFTIALIWDAITDLAIGYCFTRFSGPYSEYRKWILIGIFPIGLSFIAIFSQSLLGLSGAGIIYFALITHLIFRTAYTLVCIPYGAMTSLSEDSHTRTQLSNWRIIFGVIAAIIVALTFLPLSNFLGEGSHGVGFFKLSLIYTTFGSVALYFCHRGTKGMKQVRSQSRDTLKQLANFMVKNRPFHVIIITSTIISFTAAVNSKTLVYYFKYNLGSETLAGLAFAIIAAVILILTPVWARIGHKTSKRNASLMGFGITIIGNVLFFSYSGNDPKIVLILIAFIACGTAALPIAFWSMLPDTIEIGEFLTGIRAESLVYGAGILSFKLGAALAAITIGFTMENIGYQPNVVQSEQTLRGFHMIITLIPLLGSICGLLVMKFYIIDAALHKRLVSVLTRKRLRV